MFFDRIFTYKIQEGNNLDKIFTYKTQEGTNLEKFHLQSPKSTNLDNF
jgi:hypothetical protein